MPRSRLGLGPQGLVYKSMSTSILQVLASIVADNLSKENRLEFRSLPVCSTLLKTCRVSFNSLFAYLLTASE